ncbi:TVP38/TMEM64 family protein [Halorarius litoreus]|uniref:TVP38/TMEM64 family protein n=1 Tax=Halorarius litoreus TaxID=2962676 RepID=UPI0020CDDF83|nr:TVP38/TMEM64 family protein [Halorarius litoreus]
MPVFVSRRARRTTLVWVAVLVVLFAVGVLLGRRYAPVVTDPVTLRALVSGFGPWAPLAFVLLQAAQVVAAPIPGQVLGFVGGYLFGTLHGALYSLLGVSLGSALAFALSRRYGRPYVERVLTAETLERFDDVAAENATFALFVAFLVPGLPDDALCFVAGLTEVPLWKLVAIAVVGRGPAFLLAAFVGSETATGGYAAATLVTAALVVLSVAGFLARDRITAWLGGPSRR